MSYLRERESEPFQLLCQYCLQYCFLIRHSFGTIPHPVCMLYDFYEPRLLLCSQDLQVSWAIVYILWRKFLCLDTYRPWNLSENFWYKAPLWPICRGRQLILTKGKSFLTESFIVSNTITKTCEAYLFVFRDYHLNYICVVYQLFYSFSALAWGNLKLKDSWASLEILLVLVSRYQIWWKKPLEVLW